MIKDINTFLERKRENHKTFREIKIALKELLNDTKIQNKSKEKIKLIQESKEKIEKNIIKNLKEGLKILSGDYLYPLKYLTSYNTIFIFSQKADNIFPGDILKLEGENLIILRKGNKIHIGKIIKKNSKIIKNNKLIKPKKEEKINFNFNKKEWDKKSSIYLNTIDDIDYDDYNYQENNKNEIKNNLYNESENIFKNFFQKIQIPNISKENLLELTNNDYIKAITILLIYKNEQGLKEGFLSRNYIKQKIKKLDPDLVKSKGLWQIRTNAIGKEKLKLFFQNEKKLNLRFLSIKDKELFNKLKNSFTNNGKLTKEEKTKLLENDNLAIILVDSIISIDKKRINYLIKKIWNIDIINKKNLSKKEIFFITTKLADSYHLGPVGAIIGGLFTDNSLKIAEKLGILEKDGKILANTQYGGKISDSYQTKIRKEHKGFINSLTGKTNFYKRNTEIQKETIKKIIEYLEKKENKKFRKLKIQTYKIRNGYIPKEITELVNNLNKKLNFSILDITDKDYKNTDPNKAVLVGNYGPRAWRSLKK